MVDTVITEVAPAAPGVTLGGEKLHEALVGSPEQDNATAELKVPPTALTVTVYFTDWACFTEAELGLAVIEKSTPTPFRLTAGLADVIPSEPPTVRAPRRVPSAVGVNATLKVHEVPPRTPAPPQVFDWEKSPVIPMLENRKQPFPVLLKVTGRGLLDVFSA